MRSNPRSSWEAAVRHLFRHVHEPRELRRNPIAVRFLPDPDTAAFNSGAALKPLHAAVVAALERCESDALAKGRAEESRRYRAIIMSHVLASQPWEEVARELHLSRSRFYHERNAICDRIARVLDTREEPSPAPKAAVLQPEMLAIAHAKQLFEGCELPQALDLLGDLARHSNDPTVQIEAICLGARTLISRLDYAPAEQQLRAARSILEAAASSLSDPKLAQCRLQIDVARAFLASSRGDFCESQRLIATTLDAAYHNTSEDEYGAERQIDVLLLAAEQAFIVGHYKASRSRLRVAQTLFSNLSTQSLRHKASMLFLTGRLSQDKSSGISVADGTRFFMAALTAAQKDGLIRTAAEAAMALAQNYAYYLGNLPAALEHARCALDIVLRSKNPTLIGAICVDVVSLRRANHEYEEALRVLEIARRFGKLDALDELCMYLTTSDVYIGVKRFDLACRFARMAWQLASQQGNHRAQAAALRTVALSSHYNGEQQAARESISEAIELSNRYSSRSATAETHFISSIITGNSDHARLAKIINPRFSSTSAAR